MSKKTDAVEAERVALAWGVACELRREIDRMRVARWPLDSMTAKEIKRAAEASAALDAAVDAICRLQGSLSERSKAMGKEHPDWRSARALNG